MNKKMISILSIFLIAVLVMSLVYSVNAEEAIGAMKGLKSVSDANSSASGKLGPIINTIIGFIQVVGTGISVIMVTMLGIKYMLAAPADKADVKKQITPLVVGAIVLFASANIIQIIADYAAKLPSAG